MEISFNITHYLNINVQMVFGVRYCSNFKEFRDVSVFNKEILDTTRHIRFDEMDQNSMFIAYLLL